MARDYFISGESLVLVKGSAGSGIASLSQLGLPFSPIQITHVFNHKDITLDAWGGIAPAEVQVMLMTVNITIDLIHFDPDILNVCITESLGGAPAVGAVARAGARMGNNLPRFANGNHFIGLNIASPVGNRPWRFYFAYLSGQPVVYPLGTEKSVVRTTWEAIPYVVDPANIVGGVILGATGSIIYDHVLDT